jgi:hypothetical protein
MFRPEKSMTIDWHSAVLTRSTLIDKSYKNTQNVRRFLTQECGENFRFDRDFMAWIHNDTAKNLGDVADEWVRRWGEGRKEKTR